ncbi:MAG: hypothetical protein WD187_04145 [Candidatus Woykebacteria bacterium]
MQKVLLVEDDDDFIEVVEIGLRSYCDLIVATTEAEARVLFREYLGTIDIIVMDACLHTTKPNTQQLTSGFRAQFDGIILASSRSSYFGQQIVEAGADRWVPKHEVLKEVRKLVSAN